MENNQHIDNFLKYYCDLQSPQYAVMLKGKWGSGKTFYINQFMDKLAQDKKEYIYISLYGVTSYDEIETKFFQELHPILSDKKMLLAGKIANGMMKSVFRVDLDNNDKINATVNLQLPNIDLKEFKNTEGYILIFDDLERCSISINNILGYINYFVEHQSYRVILIANEKELKKNDEYKKIKEKLIGKAFELVPDTDLAIDSFIKEIGDDKIESIISIHLDTIKEVHFTSTYNNLRLLRQTILDFVRFYKIAISEYDNNEFMRDVIKLFFILSIENKYNAITLFKESNTKIIESKELDIKYKINLQYCGLFKINVWIDIVNKSIIDKDEIQKSILSSKYFIDEKSPNWKRLQYFYNLKDDEFYKVYKNTMNDFIDNKCKDVFEIINIYKMFLYLNTINLIDIDENEIFDIVKKNIDYMYDNKIINKSISEIKTSVYREDNYYKSDYINTTIQYHKDLKDYIKSVSDKVDSDNIQKNADNLINSIGQNDEIYKLLSNNGDQNNYYQKPIFNKVDVDLFVEKLKSVNVSAIRNIGYVLDDRYKQGFYAEKLITEKSFLDELKVKLTKEQAKLNGKVSGHNLKVFIEYPLQKAIDDLQKYLDTKAEKE
jgi:hypothetical protein